MDEDYITRREHEEYVKRIDKEDERQNHRITILEDTVRQINDLVASTREMAVSMKNMLEEQKRQGKRLEALEREPADAHRQVKMAIITAVISVLVGAVVGAVVALI